MSIDSEEGMKPDISFNTDSSICEVSNASITEEEKTANKKWKTRRNIIFFGLMGMIFAVSGYRRVHFNHQIQCPMNNVAMRRRAFELPVGDSDKSSELKYEFTMNSVHVSNRTEQDWCKFSLWGFSAGRTVISAEAVDLDTDKAWARLDVTEQDATTKRKSFELDEPLYFETELSGYTEVFIGIKEDSNYTFNFVFRSNRQRPDFVRTTGPTYIVWFWLPMTFTLFVCACLFCFHKLENYGIEQKKKRYDFRVENGLKYGDPGDFTREQLRIMKIHMARIEAMSISSPQSPRPSRALHQITV